MINVMEHIQEKSKVKFEEKMRMYAKVFTNNKFSSDPNDCRVFYQCNNLKAYRRTCQINLAFNNKINVCDFKKNVLNC